MAPIPSGTVTFLITDIEGSTQLWEDDPELMRQAVAARYGIRYFDAWTSELKATYGLGLLGE